MRRSNMNQHIYLIGLNHKTASVDVRENFALTDFCSKETWAIPVRDNGCKTAAAPPESLAQPDEALILSTCNRVEILAVGTGDIPAAVLTAWAAARHRAVADLEPYVYVYKGTEAVRHLFSVASSLDSMVLGEPQILGQLKDAYRKATLAGASKTIVNRLLHKSFSVAKRVRTETGVASSAVSISYAAVELAKRIFADMGQYRAMLIGAGEMAELAATHLIQAGIHDILVCNRTFERAVDLARQFKGEPVHFEHLNERLPEVDIIISSTGSPDPVIRAEDIKQVLKRRRYRPMFFIDIAVPRDVEPAVNNLDNVYVYDIDDLKEVVEENLARRRDEARHAEAIVEEEVAFFSTWLRSLELQPTITALLQHYELHAREELNRTLKRLAATGPVDDATREALETMLHSLVRKLSHEPIAFLRQADQSEAYRINLVRQIFGLDAPLDREHSRHHKYPEGNVCAPM